MPRQFCLGIFWFRFAAVAFRKRSTFSNDTHNSFTLCSVYLDLEFISSPAKLWKAQADNRLHVGKAHFQYAICLNALLCDTSFVSVPLLVSNRYAKGTRGWTKKHKHEGLFRMCITSLLFSTAT